MLDYLNWALLKKRSLFHISQQKRKLITKRRIAKSSKPEKMLYVSDMKLEQTNDTHRKAKGREAKTQR